MTAIKQCRTRQDTERVKSWIVPNAQSQPQQKQRSGRASTGGRACTVYTAQMLWQIRNTSLAVASPSQPTGTHACRPACLNQVHIVMQIAYGLTNAMEIVVRLRPSYIV